MTSKNSKNRKGKSIHYTSIDVPYDLKHTCFYCGEVADTVDHVPPISMYYDYMALYDEHKPIMVPSCRECNTLLGDSLQSNIYERFGELKKRLTKQLMKYLRYEQLWDDDSVEYAAFTGDLKKFSERVVVEASIAKERLEWEHWNVSVDGVSIDETSNEDKLQLGGVKFKKYDHVLEYVKRVHKVSTPYFENVVSTVGMDKLDFALTFCKRNPVKNRQEMEVMLNELRDS